MVVEDDGRGIQTSDLNYAVGGSKLGLHGIRERVTLLRGDVSVESTLGERPGFSDLLERVQGNGVGIVLVEDATRFARDLAVQLTGHELLKSHGVELV